MHTAKLKRCPCILYVSLTVPLGLFSLRFVPRKLRMPHEGANGEDVFESEDQHQKKGCEKDDKVRAGEAGVADSAQKT